MLYQDTLTGMLHEVPDGQVYGFAEDPYGMGEVYDGLGHPLGWGFLKKFVKRAMPFATAALGPYGQIINRALPIVRQALGPTAPQLSEAPMPAAVAPVGPAVAAGIAPMGQRLPVGWRRPPVPYTGPRPRRVYLRCSAWPGPRGLVPVNAAAAPPPGPAVVTPPVVASGPVRYRSRGRRR